MKPRRVQCVRACVRLLSRDDALDSSSRPRAEFEPPRATRSPLIRRGEPPVTADEESSK